MGKVYIYINLVILHIVACNLIETSQVSNSCHERRAVARMTFLMSFITWGSSVKLNTIEGCLTVHLPHEII